VRPSYDDETLAAVFQPARTALEDPVAGPALARLATEDPDVLAAVADVDRSLIRDALRLSPFERLRRAEAHRRALARFHRVG
jgi:hypothetical protein